MLMGQEVKVCSDKSNTCRTKICSFKTYFSFKINKQTYIYIYMLTIQIMGLERKLKAYKVLTKIVCEVNEMKNSLKEFFFHGLLCKTPSLTVEQNLKIRLSKLTFVLKLDPL